MYNFSISFSSPSFDMLVKLLLEFLFNLPFWTYLPFALFTMCSVSLLSFQINAVLDSSLDFWFQSIFLTQKYLDISIPRILMPVQVIWRMELLVHHEESSWIGNNTTCSQSCSCWMENSKHYQRFKPEPHGDTLTTTTTTKVESTLDKLKGTRVVNNEKLEDITMLRSIPCSPINNV